MTLVKLVVVITISFLSESVVGMLIHPQKGILVTLVKNDGGIKVLMLPGLFLRRERSVQTSRFYMRPGRGRQRRSLWRDQKLSVFSHLLQ